MTTNFFNPYNGIGRFIIDLSNILKENNYRIIILTGKTTNQEKIIERNNGVLIYRSALTFKFNRGYFSLPLIKDFISIQKKVDFIYFQFPLVELLPLSILTKKTKLLQYHCLPAFVSNNLSFMITNIYFKFSFIFASLFCHKIITFTNDYFYSNFINYFFKYKTSEILPFIKYSKLNDLDNKILKKDTKPIFGFLGRICEEKGIDIIIKASNLLNKRNIDHTIFIAGDLEDLRFKKYINKILLLSQDSKSVKFIGKLTEEDKNRFLQEIHILLLPSTNSFEAFGLVQLEAMNFGKLVIASSLRGVRIPIKYTKNGLLTKINDSYDLANKMIEIIEIAKDKNKKEVINSCMKHFNYNESKNEYLKLF